MAEAERMDVILCWHMHQPEYRDLRSGQYQFPWTYLHAVKDYIDMAAHLEAHVEARAVVNFAPVLLEQIADYAAQLEDYLGRGSAIRDPLLAALAEPPMPASPDVRIALMKQCLRANRKRIIERFPAYGRLAAIAEWVQEHPDTMMYLSNQFLIDLVVWYHLGWIAETVRRADPRVQQLQEKAHGFTVRDRRELLGIQLDMLRSVVPRYRRLAEAGRVELAMSPYAHPILPLLLDIRAGAETQPEAHLPLIDAYPGGRERARWQLQHGRKVFEHHFGIAPAGCWPSEGALSDATLEVLAKEGFRWSASGESVLRNSIGAGGARPPDHTCLHRVYRFADNAVDCFFRDDGLSDLIGFTYSEWHAEDAVANLVHHLENIKAACANCRDCAIVIILDGENAWEYYPENGYYFLDALYRELSRHPGFALGTFSGFLDARHPQRAHLASLKAGSWVYGTLSTWIGSPDKNRGWEMLAEAKREYDRVVASGTLAPGIAERALMQLAACEGSDWFWWFGDYNPAQSVSDFERLFRLHLSNLYQLLGAEPPAYLSESFTRGTGTPERGGVMRTGIEPT
jgi:alpha-amylase/alpha-mannosidase (GH57 family)